MKDLSVIILPALIGTLSFCALLVLVQTLGEGNSHHPLTRQTISASDASAGEAEDELSSSWKFLVMTDWHGAEWYSHKPIPGDDKFSNESFDIQTNALVNIRELYGGDLILLPGDTNDGRWHRPDWINKFMPGLTREEAVYTAGINCYSTIRNLFQASGYEKILVAVGDHELGDNYWGPHDDKTKSLPQFRDSFAKALYMDPDTDEYILKDRKIGNVDPTPYGTDFEYTSFAYKHKNALFITVDVFNKVSNPDHNYIDRENGLGGEGVVTGDVTGEHLSWFKNILISARDDDTIKHIMVQAHLPILQPVKKVASSAMFFDRGEDSEFWKTMVQYEVDIYFAGEVHANTASKATGSNLIQIVSRSMILSNFLKVTVSPDSIHVEALNEIGLKYDQYSKSEFEVIGSLSIDKKAGSGGTSIESSGDLQIIDAAWDPLIHFTFEELHSVGDRQVLGLIDWPFIIPKKVNMRGVTVEETIFNQGAFGQQYDAQSGKVTISTDDGFHGNAGYFNGGESQMGVYSFGPNMGGSIISYSIWFKTESDLEMILLHYGESWQSANRYNKNIFSLTLDDGTPTLYASTTSILRPTTAAMLGNNKLNDQGWHQVAVSMSRHSCLLSEVVVFIDGEAVETEVQNDINLFFLTYGRIGVGSMGFADTRQSDFPTWTTFHGKLDEAYVWGKTINEGILRRSPRKDFHFVRKNDSGERRVCRVHGRDGIKNEVYTSIKTLKECKKKCRRKLPCLGYKLVFSKNNREVVDKCVLFNYQTPKLKVQKSGKLRRREACYTA